MVCKIQIGFFLTCTDGRALYQPDGTDCCPPDANISKIDVSSLIQTINSPNKRTKYEALINQKRPYNIAKSVQKDYINVKIYSYFYVNTKVPPTGLVIYTMNNGVCQQGFNKRSILVRYSNSKYRHRSK